MHHEWHSLLFLHWRVSPDLIRARLPDDLEVDTFEGSAYLGIVPFYMRGLRPRFGPTCPGISAFPELNLRTYVRDRKGRRGVWFFSLDAHSRISVAIARTCFHLPYHYSKMRYKVLKDGSTTFSSRRQGATKQTFQYRPKTVTGTAAKGTLEHFLVERYRLFTTKGDALYFGELAHPPYELHEVDVLDYSKDLFALNQFETPLGPPDHTTFSSCVKVEIYSMRKVEM